MLEGLLLLGLITSACHINVPSIQQESLTSPAASSSDVELEQDIENIAKQITVRILSKERSGSGVLFKRKNNTYFILTNQHVVEEVEQTTIKILTNDGISHNASLVTSPALKNLDLALLQFKSSALYSLAQVGNSNQLIAGNPVYAAGFPNYQYSENQTTVTETRSWGLDAYHFTKGTFSIELKRSILGGYRLGYTNEIIQGMSGGPLLNKKGQLIGINGRLKYPLRGIQAFTFEDGSQASHEELPKLESLSWGIPTSLFVD